MREGLQISNVDVRTPDFQDKERVKYGVNSRQLFIGFSILILGALFYFFFRSVKHTYFLKFLATSSHSNILLSPVLTILVNSLPTFVHVFAFILMTASIFARQKRDYVVVCLAWFTIDVLFELGQSLGNKIVTIIPDWFSGFMFLENTRDYFLHGRFDYLDLLSIALGSVVAYILLIITSNYKWEAT